ncbi:MAG: RsmE family RNA methyltransferase [Lentisphaeria bacterium]|nr:RsmE family RNA methyltransferase [Lentisphaeria bacterium]
MRTVFHDHIGCPGEIFTLEPREAEHIFRVFRARPGDRVLVMDGRGNRGEAEVVDKKQLRFVSQLEKVVQEIELDLYCAIPKKAKLDSLLPQLPGLGVRSLHPLLLEHSVATGENPERWELLLREGCKQSGNPRLPQLYPPVSIDDALEEVRNSGAALYFGSVTPADPGRETPGALRAWFVGPEGGFTAEEERKLLEAGGRPLKLGSWIMRLESAAVAGLAVLNRTVPLLLCCFLLLNFAAGCSENKNSSVNKHPLMLRADRCRKEGEPALALRFYKKLLHLRPESPELRLKLATLCDEVMNDPVSALYHYNMYLALAPESPDAPAVEGYRLMARAKLFRELKRESLPKPAADVYEEQRQQLESLKKENVQLRYSVTELTRQYDNLRKLYLSRVSAAQSSAGQRKSVKQERKEKELLYTVRSGDTLSGIAAAHRISLRTLLRANGLTVSSVLRSGQVLRIP